jgi:ketosteroid isomerase-like protein
MKFSQTLYVLGLIAWSGAISAQTPQTSSAVEKTILALENKWTESQKTNNPDMLASDLSDKLVIVNSDGKAMSKAEVLADAKATKYTSVEIRNVRIAVFGDTAIATGDFFAKEIDSSGKALDEHSRWVDTWVKMPNGKWQCVAEGNARVKG